jgi:prepilin-type processing-associated H-X9-DG protein
MDRFDAFAEQNELALETNSQHIFEALSIDQYAPEPPQGLVLRTMARMATVFDEAEPSEQLNQQDQVVVPSQVYSQLQSADRPVSMGRRRADFIVMAAIAFVALGLGVSFLQKTRSEYSIVQCQNALRNLHVSLSEYASVHQGRYPTGQRAGDFAKELAQSGFAPISTSCPSDFSKEITPVAYTYTLGFRSNNGTVIGVHRPDEILGNSDLIPLAADFPTSKVFPDSGPYSAHKNGQNVLFAGGHVRFSTVSTVGINGDDIYRNQNGFVGAGLTSADACLGRPTDRP